MDAHAFGAEAGGHRVRRQFRQLPEGGNAQLPERFDGVHVRGERFFRHQHTQRLRGQEFGRATEWDHLGGARRDQRGGDLVGGACEGVDAAARGGVDKHLERFVLGPVEAARGVHVHHHEPGSYHLHAGGDLVEAGGERGEHAPVAVRVVLYHRQFGRDRLGVAHPHPAADAQLTRGVRAHFHPVLRRDRDGFCQLIARFQPRRLHRPVREPQRRGPHVTARSLRFSTPPVPNVTRALAGR